jgi:DNA-binding PadR family transcriptional regulator
MYVIDTNQPLTGYQIRKKFIEITKKGLSFGTLVPMLHRFEKSGYIFCILDDRDGEAGPRYWSLTPSGVDQLQARLALLIRVLRASGNNKGSFTWGLDPIPEKVEARIPFSY